MEFQSCKLPSDAERLKLATELIRSRVTLSNCNTGFMSMISDQLKGDFKPNSTSGASIAASDGKKFIRQASYGLFNGKFEKRNSGFQTASSPGMRFWVWIRGPAYWTITNPFLPTSQMMSNCSSVETICLLNRHPGHGKERPKACPTIP